MISEKEREFLCGFGNVPVPYSALKNFYKELKAPQNKVATLWRDGYLTRIKKGYFLISEKITGKKPSLFVLANSLYGPSYVSFENALSHYGLIPERTEGVSSATLKRTKTFRSELGAFTYRLFKMEYYKTGIENIEDSNGNSFLIASKEKALCDLIVARKNLRIQSKKEMREFLFENLRIDEEELKNFDSKKIEIIVQYAMKKSSLEMLAEVIDE